jgi:hypothetical protein
VETKTYANLELKFSHNANYSNTNVKNVGEYSMNKTEKLAYNWLLSKGISAKDIFFQKKASPDFLTVIGNFEVKKTHNFTVAFTNKQLPLLNDDKTTFLIYFKNSEEPLVYKGVNLKGDFTICVSKPIVTAYLSDEAITVLDASSRAAGKSRSEFLEWVITKGFEQTPEVKAKIAEITKLQEKLASSQLSGNKEKE